MADLLAYQFDDAIDGEATAKSREDRKRRAFLDSKESYPNEPVIISAGWFLGSVNNLEDFTSEHEAKDVVLAVQHLYFSRKYDQALKAALLVMDKMVAVDGPGRKTASHARELEDLALRSAIQTGNSELAAGIADRTRSRWDAMPGSAASAGQAYLLANRPRDAISALLASIKSRPYFHRYVSCLVKAFEMLQQSSADSDLDAPSPETTQSLIRTLRSAVKRGIQFENSGTLLFAKYQSHEESPVEPSFDETIREEELVSCLESLGFKGDENKHIIEICAYGRGADITVADEADGPGSVRHL
ncbi:hypothetical protein FRB90_012300 [Tulasnella sp. 427]|nr:hypothetical protein FRB90_012300 [Tulasnella sp. 427]